MVCFFMVSMVTMTVMKHNDSKIIDALGGTTQVAQICEVRPQAVSKWRRDGIPPARRMYLGLLKPKVFKAKKVA